jgi:hypothetical protein
MVNIYLGSDYDQQIRSLATTSGDLKGYVHEAQSSCSPSLFLSFSPSLAGLDPPFQGVYRKWACVRE